MKSYDSMRIMCCCLGTKGTGVDFQADKGSVRRCEDCGKKELLQYEHPFKRQPVVTRFSTFKGRRKVDNGEEGVRWTRTSVPRGSDGGILSLHRSLVFFLLILVHHVPFTTRKFCFVTVGKRLIYVMLH